MIKERFKTETWSEIENEHPYISEEDAYPKFKKGDVVFVLRDNTSYYEEFKYDRYDYEKRVIVSGEPEEHHNFGWQYDTQSIENYLKDDYMAYDTERIIQINMFYKLSELKEAVRKRTDYRITKLQENIDSVKAQMK